jgi:hypothetical protein
MLINVSTLLDAVKEHQAWAPVQFERNRQKAARVLL